MESTSKTHTVEPAAPRGARALRRTLSGARTRRTAWLVAAPAVVAVALLHFAPTVAGMFYAFTDWQGIGPARWIGLGNFRELFHNRETRGALWNTLRLTGGFVLLGNAIGLAIALGLNRTVKSRYVLRALFFAPVVLSPIAIGYLWQYIFQSDGALNRVLGAVGLKGLQHVWLGDPRTALWCILVTMLWQLTGLMMVIYLAGLASISDEYYEAAAVDGASALRQFFRITVPSLAPAFTINITLSLLLGLRVFDQVIALTYGGPANTTQTLATQVYMQAFTLGRFGYSTALAVMLTLLIVLFVSVQALLPRLPRLWRRA
jgi:raffinose/stachyose/melibiose transport system permease protein